MSIEKQQEILHSIGTTLFQSAPEGWKELECKFSAIGLTAECSLYRRPENGEFQRISSPTKVAREFLSLRKAMKKPETGSWFTATFRLANNGKYTVEYDYDNKPEFSEPGPSVLEFIHEQKYYQRSEEKIPDWLRTGIVDAENY